MFTNFQLKRLIDLEMAWKSFGNLMRIPAHLPRQKTFPPNQTLPPMEAKEFYVFRTLLADVHSKAFGEQLSKLSYGKAQTLSWLIHEATGELLCYKSLSNYVAAALEEKPHAVNPTNATLAILVRFIYGDEEHNDRHQMRMGAYAPWYKYRGSVLSRPLAA